MMKNNKFKNLTYKLMLSALTLSPFVIQNTHAAVKNIVLVHGAFADGSSWNAVSSRLQSLGYHVTSVQNPLTSLDADVEGTKKVLERQKGDVLLVGHSWGGVVVTKAGNAPNVKGIVYLSALVPDSNESASDLLTRLKSPMEGLEPDKNGLIWLDDAKTFQHVMANDLPEKQAKLLASVQQPIAAQAFTQKISEAAWRVKPTWYLITTNDNALKPRTQELISKQAHSSVIRVNSSHLSLISHPDQVSNLIDKAAKSFK
ncbi:alpha/beta hydrolase [Acinetobacter seifertii]|uniref:alpha/beta hydrolase n=1 Tax=Acinetobacter seifertii TaxID=1530123 RepID=UPI00158026FD|nr:alpha/beta hydrolase [Acinetobacter seifertii]NUG13197.1 alpha/beta hydrolase [Acinetobacter seifertii]